MAALERSDVLAVLKEFYPDAQVPKEELYTKAPLFAMFEKDEEASGEFYKVPLKYGNPQGRSATFSNAQGNQRPSKWAGFDVQYADDYGTAAIHGKVIDASRNDRGAFVRHFKNEMDGSIQQLKRSAVHAIFRNGGGSMGQISTDSTVASLVIKLAQVTDIVFFEVGQVLEADDTDGSSGGAVRAGSAEISAINRITGELTTATSNWSTKITGLAVSDHLFVQGDFGLKMKGLDAWIPSTDPSATLFHNVDRSVDTLRLGGVRYDASSQNVEEGLIDGVELTVRHGGSPDVIVLHPKQYARLVKLLGSKAVYDKRTSEDGKIGFRVLKLTLDSGDVDVVSDAGCQIDVAWALQMDTWVIASMGRIPKVLDDDGLPYLRQASADGVEVRSVYRGNLACYAPGWNGRIKLAA